MMRSLFSGVSGLRSNQLRMDVIGNNIANANTVGYKAARVTFSNMLSQTLSRATGANPVTGGGGSNPMQVGLGVQISSIDTIMSPGSTESTGSATDLSIGGDGFFIVRNGTTGSYMFTRAGNFTIDENGNLTTSDGMNVYGWMAYDVNEDGSFEFNTDNSVQPINLYTDGSNGNKQNAPAEATTYATFTGSLNAAEAALYDNEGDFASNTPEEDEVQYSTTMTVYDSLGNAHELTVNYTKGYVDTTDPENPVTNWYWSVAGDAGETLTEASGYLRFNSLGQIISDDADTEFSVTPEITITPSAESGAGQFTVNIDFSGLSMTAADSSVQTSDVDGNMAGTLDDIAIDSNGMIIGVYSNGAQRPLGMVALAQFDNPAGLERVGSNYFIATSNSGEFTNGVAANGSLASGTLEMSNVDLSEQFSQMIITQRGYQACSRIITTSDEMLQTLIEMKRVTVPCLGSLKERVE